MPHMTQRIEEIIPMSKKKKPTPRAPAPSSDGKTSFQLRLDSCVHEKLKLEAKKAGISLNQLILGVCQFAADNIRQGRPLKTADELLETPATECVWFGHPSECGNQHHRCEPEFYFILDFSGRNAVDPHLPKQLDDEGNLY